MKTPKLKIGKDLANLLKTRFKTKVKISKKLYSKKDRASNKKYKEGFRPSFFMPTLIRIPTKNDFVVLAMLSSR